MERGSSKHGRQLDEELAREALAHTQGGPAGSRVGEERDPELAAGDEPEPSWIPAGDRPDGAPAPLSGAELEARSRLGRAVPRSALPGDRSAVLRAATELGAEPEALAELARLPAGRTFATVYEIWEALGHRNEQSR